MSNMSLECLQKHKGSNAILVSVLDNTEITLFFFFFQLTILHTQNVFGNDLHSMLNRSK